MIVTAYVPKLFEPRADDESEPKSQKICRSKIDVTSQLEDYLGSDI